MRILWFTTLPMPAVCRRNDLSTHGFGGHWIAALLSHLVQHKDISLGVACAFPGLQDDRFVEEGVSYFAIGQSKRYSPFRFHRDDLRKCVDFVNEFQPDVIHVHGTERFFGLLAAQNLTEKPLTISIQGLLGPYAAYRNFFGNLSPWQVVRSTRLLEIGARLGLGWSFLDMQAAAKREAEVISAVGYFMGRTDWDRAHVLAINPLANYFEVGEILRDEFYGPRWTPKSCKRYTIVHVNAGHPRRGTETLIRALRILRGDFPDVRLRMAGTISERSGYGRFLRRYIKDHGVADRVEMTGYLDGNRIVSELLEGHVFVIPSYIENSPNSLAEAMLIGMPCVASYVGGIPSLVEDGRSGLFFPAGDEALLANSIRRIFTDDDLAFKLGSGAQEIAARRHDPDLIVNQLLAAYNKINADSNEGLR